LDKAGVPVDLQKLSKIMKDDGGDDDGDDDESSKVRLEAPGNTKSSATEAIVVDDRMIELEPMMINVRTPDGETIPLQVSPSNTVSSSSSCCTLTNHFITLIMTNRLFDHVGALVLATLLFRVP
jgi:hypothetical protein